MHIVDGALSAPVLISGGLLAVAGVAAGLKRLDSDRVPQVGLLSAAFFVASLIHLPVVGTASSVHLILNGLVGLALGWAAFPALAVALLLQAVFFGFGGLLVLGVNTVNIALPALIVFWLFGRKIRRSELRVAAVWGAVGGALSIAITAVMVAGSLALSGDNFLLAAKLVLLSHIPVALLEGFITGAAVLLISQVKPEFFSVSQGESSEQN